MSDVVVVAPSAFKGSLTASEAAIALSDAVRVAMPDATVITFPIADGGDGTAALIAEHVAGDLCEAPITGPSGEPMVATYAWLDTDVAVIDVASAAGIAITSPDRRDAMSASSTPVGELVGAVLARSPRRLIVGAGGSASTDAGCGLLSRLGVGFFDSQGRAIEPGARGLLHLDRVDVTFRNRSLAATEIVVACDVDSPLIGENGAARVFGPQKGASPEDVELMERALERFASVVLRDTGRWVGEIPRAGAAGGIAAGLYALAGADLADGFGVFAELVGFETILAQASLLVVGEGSLDAQSLLGKGPIAAARRAKRLGIPVWAFAGRVELDQPTLADNGVVVEADLSKLMGAEARADPAGALARLASQMFRRHQGGRKP